MAACIKRPMAGPPGTDGRIALALHDDGTTKALLVSIPQPSGWLFKLLKSTNGGAAFTDLTANLPDYNPSMPRPWRCLQQTPTTSTPPATVSTLYLKATKWARIGRASTAAPPGSTSTIPHQ